MKYGSPECPEVDLPPEFKRMAKLVQMAISHARDHYDSDVVLTRHPGLQWEYHEFAPVLIAALEERLPLLGKGNYRAAFDNGGCVIKIGKSLTGVEHNRQEAANWAKHEKGPRGKLLAPVLATLGNGVGLVMRKAERVGKGAYGSLSRKTKYQINTWCGDLCKANAGYIDGKPVLIDYPELADYHKLEKLDEVCRL